MGIYDLTHFIEMDMTAYCIEEKPEIRELATIKNDGYNVKSLHLNTHIGTHIDMPNHMFEEGRTLDSLEAFKMKGNAFILDCSNEECIEKDFILKNIKEIHKYNYIIFKTGAEKFWKKEKYLKEYVTLSKEAAHFLGTVEELYGIGVDCISVDKENDETMANHKELLGKGKIIIENLCNLKELNGEVEIIVAPLKIKGADGAPARVFVI